MAFRTTHIGITPREKELLFYLLEAQKRDEKKKIEYAARKMGLKAGSVRGMLFRLRERYFRAATFVDEYRDWRKKLERSRLL